MRRDDLVVRHQRRAHADRDGLLADVAVDDAVNAARGVVVGGTLLEAADRLHLAEHLALLIGQKIHCIPPIGSDCRSLLH